MQDNKENLEISLIRSIGTSDLKDLGMDLSEIAFDSVLDDGVLKEIPVIGSIAKLYSAGSTISGKIFEKKIIKFMIALEEINLKKRKQFVDRIAKDEKFERKVGEHLLVALDRIDNMDKPPLLAKIFSAYINDHIDYELFLRFSSILDKLFLPDLFRLSSYRQISKYDDFISQSLESQGLVYQSIIDGGTFDSFARKKEGNKYSITELGEMFLSVIEN